MFSVIQVEENLAGLGFIAFSLCMTIGRFFGDRISLRFGSIKIILGGCALAVIGCIGIVASNLFLTVLGFGILGLGLSVIIPEIFRLAGSTENVSASAGISVVSGIGFAGFLVGPVLLGIISDWASLVWSFGFMSILIVLAFVITFISLRKNYP